MYLLFIKGWLFKIPLFFAGGFGIAYLIGLYLPDSRNTFITVSGGIEISWAVAVAIGICIMALATTKD